MPKICRRHKVYIAILTTFFSYSVIMYLADHSTTYSREQSYDEIKLNVPTQTTLDTNEAFSRLLEYIKSRKGEYSFVIQDLESSETYAYNEQQPFYAASLYKTPLAVAALKEVEKSNLSMTQSFSYYPQDYADGTGTLVQKRFGTAFSLEEILKTLIKDSDNVSQNILLRTLPSNAVKEAFSIVPQESYFSENVATASEISNYFRTIYQDDYLNNTSKAYLLDLLSSTAFDDRISKYLKSDVTFSHKIGSWPGNYHDCGLAFTNNSTYTICLLSGNTSYEEFLDVSKNLAGFFNKIDQL